MYHYKLKKLYFYKLIFNTHHKIKNELSFYKSIFDTHRNSVIFNLTIKKRKGQNVWIDHIRDNRKIIESLDRDDEVIEWLKPIKCSK